MKNKDENIVMFTPRGEEHEDLKESGDVLSIGNTWLLRNATLFSPRTMKSKVVDILIKNDRIVEISKHIQKMPPRCEELDLNFDYVLPLFVNGYENWLEAVEKNYGAVDADDNDVRLISLLKTSATGGFSFFQPDQDHFMVVENIAELSDDELSDMSSVAALTASTVFLRVGQTLEELGAIDKRFHKPLSQVLEDFGFLDRNCAIVGGNCFEKDDFELFAQHGVSFVICPQEDAKLGRRPLNLKTLAHLGINVMFGSGSMAELDYFEAMRMVLASQRCMFEDENALTEEDVLYLALGGDHRVLSYLAHTNVNKFLDLKAGSYANFMVVQNLVNFFGSDAKNLVWGKNRGDVTMTVFRGEIIQFCSRLTEFKDFEEQFDELSIVEHEFHLLRNREKRKNKKDKGEEE